MAADVVMNDMDIDFEDPEIARLQAEAAAINARAAAEAAEQMNGVQEPKEAGELDDNDIQPTKVHVRGVDKLNTTQLEQWVAEHAGSDLFRKVQWVDDNSANLIFDTEIAASDALSALSAAEGGEPLELRQAKELSSHPDHVLQVRMALVSDVKVRGAKDHSAFYLFNPEWDPDNPNNVRHQGRKRRWADDGGRERHKYRRREWEDDRMQRRGSTEQGTFTEDMYDEGGAAASVQQDSRRASSGSEYGRRKVTFDDDLFAPKQDGRLRDRSASPGREGDGRYGFAEDQPRRRTARPRSATPPTIRKNRENRNARDSARKELFPDKPTASKGYYADRGPATPPPSSSATGPRELFPDMTGTPNHRRNDGRDLPLDEVVQFMGESSLEGRGSQRAYRDQGTRPSSSSARSSRPREGRAGAKGDLFARVSGAPESGSNGRLSRDGEDDVDVKFKGEAVKKGGDLFGGGGRNGHEFSFLGASGGGQPKRENPLVKELFPANNGGSGKKDLFDGRIKGRASGRSRAEDLF